MADIPALTPLRQSSLSPRRQDVEYVVLTDGNDTRETTLLEYLRLIWRRKWLTLLPVVCIMPLIWLYVARQTPRYTATATVSIEDTNPRVLSIPEVQPLDRSPNFYSTQYEILKGRTLAEEVVDTLHLDSVLPPPTAAPNTSILQTIKELPGRVLQPIITSMTPRSPEPPTQAPSPEAAADLRRQRAVGRLLNALTIEPRKGTKLVDVILQGDDPLQVARQVNTLAAAYAKQNLEKRLEASRKASIWLEKEADSLRAKIAEGERRLQTVKEDRRLLTSDISNTQSTDLNSLGALNLSYLDKRRERLTLRAELEELRKVLTSADLTQSAKHPAILNNPTVSGLQTRYLNLQIEHAELAKKFMDKHPKMVLLSTERDEVRKAIREEVQRVIASLETQYNTLTTQENNLQQLLNTQKSTVIRSEKDMMTYETLRRDLDVHKAMYLDISKRFAETTLTTALETNNVTVVEQALSGVPVPSGTLKYLLLGSILSLACGGGLALLAESLDKKFKNVAEVEQFLALPFLGFVPHYVLSRRRPPALITLQKPSSDAAESYRTLRTWVQLAKPPIQTLLVTSAVAEEGKSTTAANLAVSFAQLGQRVLLVDADLRKPSLHRVFGSGKKQGLADVLARGLEWQSVVQETPMDNLKVLFAGSYPLNPAELLSMSRLHHLMEDWESRFDRVIFDSPIVLSIPDVMLLAPVMDGVLLVHSQGCSTREMAIETKKRLERAGATLLGMIFNNVRPKDMQHYHSYDNTQVYGSTGSRAYPQQDMTDQALATPVALEMRSTIMPTPQWAAAPTSPPTTASVPPVLSPAPMVIDREGHSNGLHITLHAVTPCSHLGLQQAGAGSIFLIVDVTITNRGGFGHLFDPSLTTLTTRAETDYGHALASVIPIDGAGDDTEKLQAARALGDYDPALTAHLDGFTTVAEIAAAHTSRGALVYHIPEASSAYLFVYTNAPIVINIPFTVHL